MNMNEINANDLYLFAVGHEELHARCIKAVQAKPHRRGRVFMGIIKAAWGLYRGEVNDEAVITGENLQAAATLLEADRVAYVAKIRQVGSMDLRYIK